MTACNVSNFEFKREHFFSGDFSGEVAFIELGQAGLMRPSSWQLRATSISRKSKSDDVEFDEFTSYVLTLTAVNENNISFTGKYGFPHAQLMSPYDYGHGFAGLLSDAPEDIVAGVSEATGVDLLELT